MSISTNGGPIPPHMPDHPQIGQTGRVPAKESKVVPQPPPLPETPAAPLAKERLKSTPRDEEKIAKQERAIEKIQANVLKKKQTHQPLERELVRTRDAMSLRQTTRDIKRSKATTGKRYDIPSIGRYTQNPVGKLGGPQYIDRQALEKNLNSQKIDHRQGSEILEECGLEVRLKKYKEAIFAIGKRFAEVDKNDTEAVKLELNKAIAELTQLKEAFSQETPFNKRMFKATPDQLEVFINMLKALIVPPPTLEHTSSYVNKDDVLRGLRLLASTLPEEKQEEIFAAITEVKKHPEPFIDKNEIDALHLPLKQLIEYVSIPEFVNQNNPRSNPLAVVKTTLEAIHFSGNEFVFKTGLENTREMLGYTLVASMGLSKPLVPKIAATIKGATFGQEQDPQGIASTFIKGASSFPRKQWDDLTYAKRRAALASFLLPFSMEEAEKLSKIPESQRNQTQNDDLNDLQNKIASSKEIIANFEKAKADVLALGGLESIADHVLTDILFCSYDSHMQQYLFKDGEIYNVDFARFLTPSDTFVQGEGKNRSVYATFRTTWLDHPITSLPIPQRQIDAIINWNIEEIESQWRHDGLIGDDEMFNHAAEKVAYLREDYNSLRLDSLEKLNRLCDTYGISKGEPDTMKRLLASTIQQQFDAIRMQCFEKIHPRAFKEFKERALALQNYVKKCVDEGKDPTLAEAFPLMYPHLAPFMKVLDRMEENTGEAIGISFSPSGLRLRSLQSIINHTMNSGLATREEIEEMFSAWGECLNHAPDIQQLDLTISISL